MDRLLLFALAVLCSAPACRCAGLVSPPDEPLRVEPSLVDFGSVWLGTRAERLVVVFNPNRSSRVVPLPSATPFRFGRDELVIAAGESVELEAVFEPTEAGAVQGTLEIGSAVVELRGTGMTPPACTPSATCRISRFDPPTGACVESDEEDGASCTPALACLESPRCAQGQCVGGARTCDDGDACTVDGCSEAGCTRVPRECPEPSSACQVGVCSPRTGCGTELVADGTPCGNETCEEARLCLAGQCVVRQKPDAPVACRYQDLDAYGDRVCALARNGRVVCWGNSLRGPLEIERWRGARSLSGGCAVLASGTVECVGRGVSVNAQPQTVFFSPAFSGPVHGVARRFVGRLCAALEDGGVECLLGDGGVERLRLPATSQISVSTLGVCAGVDGGVVCDDGAFRPFDTLTALGRSSWAATLADGGSVNSLGVALPPVEGFGGALISVTFSEHMVCGFSGREVLCASFQGQWRRTLPNRIVKLTRAGFGAARELPFGPLCALDVEGLVWCAGSNEALQLGDRSPFPRGLVELGRGEAMWLGRASQWLHTSTHVVRQGSVYEYGPDAQRAGVALLSRSLVDPQAPIATFIEGLMLTVDGGVFGTGGERLQFAGGVSAAVSDPYGTVVLSGDEVWRVSSFGPPRSLGRGLAISRADGFARLLGEPSLCTIRPDAGLDCVEPGTERHLDTPPLRRLASSGRCAVTTSGVTLCRATEPDGGVRFDSVPGVRLFPRLLDADVTYDGLVGCAVSGLNGLQCWGPNTFGNLGRDSPAASAFALDVPVSEAISELSVRWDHACVRTVSGRVLCWGSNQAGALGFLPTLHSTEFVSVTY